jgi:hypothetical protein
MKLCGACSPLDDRPAKAKTGNKKTGKQPVFL